MIGEALVPYYRQVLPIFNLFRNSNISIGDGIEYSQRKRLNLGESDYAEYRKVVKAQLMKEHGSMSAVLLGPVKKWKASRQMPQFGPTS